MALVLGGAAVVYRETDLLTGSLVLLAGLMIAALFARRVAVREERAGMADWEQETLASAEGAEALFGDWAVSSPRDQRNGSEPTPQSPPAHGAGSVGRPAGPAGQQRARLPHPGGRRGPRAG